MQATAVSRPENQVGVASIDHHGHSERGEVAYIINAPANIFAMITDNTGANCPRSCDLATGTAVFKRLFWRCVNGLDDDVQD